MDTVDLYFLNKANVNTEDEFLTEISQSDMTNLSKTKRTMLTLPIFAFGLTYFIRSFRDRVFVSNNFLVNFMSIRSKYKDTYTSKSLEERHEELKDVENPYKEIKQKNIEKAQKAEIVGNKASEEIKVPRRQNPDPFEMRNKRQGLVPASRSVKANAPKEHIYFMDESQKSAGLSGNQIINKGSVYTNLLRTYTDYEQNKRFEKEKVNAEERAEKRNIRFKVFKRINVEGVRNRVMNKRVRGAGKMFVVIPTILAFIAAASNYATVNFGVYLKYQAMVDTYYLQKQAEAEKLQSELENTPNERATA
jgi:hypothetical protein